MAHSSQHFSWEDEELSTLLSKEQETSGGLFINGCHEHNPSLLSFCEARHGAIEWIMKVVSHYSFSALTAFLAVNYLDRFLFGLFHHQSHTEKMNMTMTTMMMNSNNKKKPWMTQLSAVACLSLAAKVEEVQVPLLLDFQVEECEYIFEAKTIQRMELLVLSTLEWKMNPITPFSFLDYITRRLGLKTHQLSLGFLRRCEDLLLAVISDCRFMCYLPSVMATATLLHVVQNIQPCTLVEFQDQLLSILGIDKKEKVEQCCRVVKEVATTIQFYSSNKRKNASLPGSPKGVMDVSFASTEDASKEDDSSS